MSIDNSTGKTKGFYERGQAIFDRIPKGEEMSDERTITGLHNFKPDYTMTFSNDTGVVGKLDFNGPVLVFTGDADESAKLFINAVKQWFHGRMQWVGLTDAEIGGLCDFAYSDDEEFVRHIETKLKEKNGG